MSDPQCVESMEAEQIEIEAKGKSLVVEFPLKVFIGNMDPTVSEEEPGYINCITDTGLEVFYFSEDEHQFEEIATGWMQEAITAPVETAEAHAPHIISDALQENRF